MFLIMGKSISQSVWSHLRGRKAGTEDGHASNMGMGTCSEPVEGSEVSQPLTNGRSWGLAQAGSIMEGRAIPKRGNLV